MSKETEDDFLGDLGNNNETDPFNPSANDDIFPEETQEEVVNNDTDAKPVPFHKDEKVQRYIDKEIKKRMKDFEPNATQTFTKDVQDSGDDDVVRALTRLVGNDTDEKKSVLADLKSALDKRDERATQRAYERLQEVQEQSEQKEQSEISEALDKIEEGFEDIENHYGIELTNRQKSAYKEFLLKVEPKGGYVEYPDFVETFDVFKNYIKAQRPSNSQAKVLASRGMERSSSSSSNSVPVLKRDGTKSLWQQIDKIMP